MYRLSAWKVNWILLFIDVMCLPPHSNQTFPQCPSSAPPELSITGRWRVGVEYRIKYNFERHLTIVISSFFIHDSPEWAKEAIEKSRTKLVRLVFFFVNWKSKWRMPVTWKCWTYIHHTNNKMHETLIFLLTGGQTAFVHGFAWQLGAVFLPFWCVFKRLNRMQFSVFPFPVSPETKILGSRMLKLNFRVAIPTQNPPIRSSIRQDAVDMILQRVRHNLQIHITWCKTELTHLR